MNLENIEGFEQTVLLIGAGVIAVVGFYSVLWLLSKVVPWWRNRRYRVGYNHTAGRLLAALTKSEYDYNTNRTYYWHWSELRSQPRGTVFGRNSAWWKGSRKALDDIDKLKRANNEQ